MELTADHIKTWMKKADKKFQDKKEYLTELDQAVGDGDHGVNMARGFSEVIKKIDQDYETPSDVLKDVAMTLMSKVGGAAGPLYGTAFLKLSTQVKGKDVIDFSNFVESLNAGVEGIKQRGKAESGEKTLLDVWVPLTESLKEQSDFDSQSLKDISESLMNKTKDIKATKGRASYLGDRSIGHLDPGSVSSFYLFEALAETIEGGQ
nr:dihydroxyacetone kinase subunit DhaL [Halobacillus massiliensis]